MIELGKVSFEYHSAVPVLDNISLHIAAGEKVGLIGPNGAGKSTLLTLLNGIQRGSGQIRIGGQELGEKTMAAIRRRVGLVFQNPDDQLFCNRVYDDLVFGLLNNGFSRPQADEKVQALAAGMDIAHLLDKEQHQMSFGERKLISIATVQVMQPQIIALDEPTSNLDAKHRRLVIEWLQRSAATLFITAHDLDMLLDVCDRVILLNSGKIIADGSAVEILNNRELLEANDLELPLRLQRDWLQQHKAG
jgi:cobalt/nickel transport system ATP-binding protein